MRPTLSAGDASCHRDKYAGQAQIDSVNICLTLNGTKRRHHDGEAAEARAYAISEAMKQCLGQWRARLRSHSLARYQSHPLTMISAKIKRFGGTMPTFTASFMTMFQRRRWRILLAWLILASAMP